MAKSFVSEDTCAVCGEASRHTHLLVTDSVGLPDLDGRPDEGTVSTLHWWIHSCPACGYCAESIALAPAKAGEIVRSEAYQRQLHDPHVPALARAFLCAAMIADASPTDIDAAVAGYSRAAWACDDAGSEDAAAGCRLRAADAIYTLHKFGGHYMDEERSGDFALLVDLYRRASHFEEATDWTSVGYPKPSTSFFPRLMALQGRLIAAGDTAAHSCGELLDGEQAPPLDLLNAGSEAFTILEESFESRRRAEPRRWPAHEPFDPRFFHWQLPALAREDVDRLSDSSCTREERERIRERYLEREAYDLMSGRTMPVRELVRFQGEWQYAPAQHPDADEGRACELSCRSLARARGELLRCQAWLGAEGQLVPRGNPGVRIVWEQTVLDAEMDCHNCGAVTHHHAVYPDLSLRCPLCGWWQPAYVGDYLGDDKVVLILGRRLREQAQTAWMLAQAVREVERRDGQPGYGDELRRRAAGRILGERSSSLAYEETLRADAAEERMRAAELEAATLRAELRWLRQRLEDEEWK